MLKKITLLCVNRKEFLEALRVSFENVIPEYSGI